MLHFRQRYSSRRARAQNIAKKLQHSLFGPENHSNRYNPMQQLKDVHMALVGRRLNPQKPQSPPYFGERTTSLTGCSCAAVSHSSTVHEPRTQDIS